MISVLDEAKDAVRLTCSERADWCDRMDANPARHTAENRKLARSRIEPLRAAYFIVEWALAAPERRKELEAYLALKGVSHDETAG